MTELLLERNDQHALVAPELKPVNGYVPTEAEQKFAQQAVAENAGHIDHEDSSWVDHAVQAAEAVTTPQDQR